MSHATTYGTGFAAAVFMPVLTALQFQTMSPLLRDSHLTVDAKLSFVLQY